MLTEPCAACRSTRRQRLKKTSKVLYKLVDVCLPIGSIPRGEDAEPGVEAGVNVISDAVVSISEAQNVRPAVEKALVDISLTMQS